jgi:putative ABC transport system permease protein
MKCGYSKIKLLTANKENKFDARKAAIMTTLRVDDHYVPALGTQIVNGRNFDLAKFPSDSTAIILNEAT